MDPEWENSNMKNIDKTSIVITYALIVILFAVLFRYGIYLSFDIDTGYVGPIFIWHAALIISLMRGRKNENSTF
jgi:hypothetical protein